MKKNETCSLLGRLVLVNEISGFVMIKKDENK